jgi:hypothetical protein
VAAAFLSRSRNKASCLRKNKFSAANAVWLRMTAAHNLRESEMTICNVTLSFRSCLEYDSHLEIVSQLSS